MDVKAGIIHILLKKKTPFLYKAEIFAERKIRQRVINEQKTETATGTQNNIWKNTFADR
ncbi:MAG: hypothetical protein WDO71_10775 [Bacteroidota bacterium]